MAKAKFIEPDLDFIHEISSAEMQKCYQCSTCTVVCPISPEVNPFPRKEMIWAQWGLKDRLLADPDVWLCHNCNDCSVNCPRGANPGDLLATLRNYFYTKNAWPAFLGKAVNTPSMLPFIIAIPAVLILLLAAINGTLTPLFPLEDGHIRYGAMFPGMTLIDPLFVSATLFVIMSFSISISKLWSGMNNMTPRVPNKGMPLVQAIIATIQEILTHSRFDECGQAKTRSSAHKALVFSFIALAIVTGVVAGLEWLDILFDINLVSSGHHVTPLPFLSIIGGPLKLLANAGALLLIYGVYTAIMNRKNDPEGETFGKQTYQDWFLLYTILTIALTGLGSELLRLVNIAPIAYSVYFIHLIAVFMLIAYLPFSKFAHIVYRTTAIIHSKHVGRYEMTAEDVKGKEAIML